MDAKVRLPAAEPILLPVMNQEQRWKGLRRFSVQGVSGVTIQEIIQGLSRGEAPSRGLLIGPSALAGSPGVPALWPLLIELKKVLTEEEWLDVQRRLIVYADNETLSRLLKEAGYEVPSDLGSLKQLLAQKAPSDLVFYMGGQDWKLRGQIQGITQGLQLTPENYLNVLGHLLELLGYVRPELELLEGLPEALRQYA